jgi:hypothetical protein
VYNLHIGIDIWNRRTHTIVYCRKVRLRARCGEISFHSS